MFPPEAGSSWGRSKAFFWLLVPGISAPGYYGPRKRQNIGVQKCGGDRWSPLVVGKAGEYNGGRGQGEEERDRGETFQGSSSSN